jgi:small subunit ribosomal protein S8
LVEQRTENPWVGSSSLPLNIMKFNVWNLFVCIVNGQKAKKTIIRVPKQKFCKNFLKVLWNDGYILGFQKSTEKPFTYDVFLKYKNEQPVINKIKFISKPSKREYFTVKQIWKLDIGVGVAYFTTNKGILSTNLCKKLNIGGELFLIIK